MLAGRAENLPPAKVGFALHVLTAIDTGEFEVCVHSLLPFTFQPVVRNSGLKSINKKPEPPRTAPSVIIAG
jgi:hypothetical protein